MTREVPQIEAVKYALRQSKDGTVVSFVIHPEDLDPALQCLPIGARVMLGWYQIGDDEQPVTKPDATPAGAVVASGSGATAGETAPPKEKDRRPFHQLPLASQCAIRCTDKQFWAFLNQREGADIDNETAADAVVKGVLRITSKKEIETSVLVGANWKALVEEFKQWLLDDQYADFMR